MAKKTKQKAPEVLEALESQEQVEAQQESPSDKESSIPQQEEVATVKVQIRTKVWQGKRIDQRRRAGIVAFPEWAEHQVSQEQLALLKADDYIEVVAV